MGVRIASIGPDHFGGPPEALGPEKWTWKPSPYTIDGLIAALVKIGLPGLFSPVEIGLLGLSWQRIVFERMHT